MIRSFTYLESNKVKYDEEPVSSVSSKLNPGLYIIEYIEYPVYDVQITQHNIINRDGFDYPKSNFVNDIVESFLDQEKTDLLNSCGMYNRFGVMLYGSPGCGKSTIINNISSKVIDNGGLIFIIKNTDNSISHCWDFVKKIRQIQDNRICILFDEFDEYMKEESFIKHIMDGQYSIDNCLFLMSTNYIDNIPASIKERPSRCKYSIKIEGVQDENIIFNIIKNTLNNMSEVEIRSACKKLKGESLDVIKQYCFDEILGLSKYQKNDSIGFKV